MWTKKGKLRVRFFKKKKFVSTLFLTFKHHLLDVFKELFKWYQFTYVFITIGKNHRHVIQNQDHLKITNHS